MDRQLDMYLQGKTPTSRKAYYKKTKAKAPAVRDLILEALKEKPMTTTELSLHLNKRELTVRPRVSDLYRKHKKITPTGGERLNHEGNSEMGWRLAHV